MYQMLDALAELLVRFTYPVLLGGLFLFQRLVPP
ncbi:hypothetical protein MED297_14235 [Reinekea sp. MED297]|uniref:Uncharacterized protein n=1 Tax=Reinekea blandensis MED297 TaxID=314283 RepID=A4BGN3_9GAMM|nr:hypothetical protein MED297_14235 [Reinekea sp. MED297] [Reinekea blandensis MED297]